MRGPARQIGSLPHRVDGRDGHRPVTGRPQVRPGLAQIGPLQPGRQKRHRMTPAKRPRKRRIGKDQGGGLQPRHGPRPHLQRCPCPPDRRPLPRIQPCRNRLLGLFRQGTVQRGDRHGPFDRPPPRHIGLARWSRQVAGAHQMHRVPQVGPPFRPPGESDARRGRAKGQPLAQQGMGQVRMTQRDMKLRQRRA